MSGLLSMPSNMKTLTLIVVLVALISGVSMSSAQHNETSQITSVYVAGKGKYCKETSVSGYLDCFYASLDACEKHNKSNLRCVANPNSGT
jgi:hypothetical protein